MFAEVRGAPEQACPYCQHVSATDVASPPAPSPGSSVDPVAALQLWARTARARYFALLAVWSPILALNVAVSFLVARTIPDPADLTFVEGLQALGVVLPPLVLVGALEFAWWGVVARAAWGDATRAFARLGPLFGLGLVLVLAYLAGFLLLVVPFLVFTHWFLHAPAALAEGRGVAGALQASRAFAAKRRTWGWTALVLLAWGTSTVIGFLVGGVLSRGLVALGVGPPLASALGESLATWPLAPLVALLPAAYWRLASGAEASGGPPAVAGVALPRATTTCPRCQTLIPVAGEGPEADVTCPTCGMRGRVARG